MKTKATEKQLREALQDLADCAQEVIDNWSHGDLAGAVNGLEGALEDAKAVLLPTVEERVNAKMQRLSAALKASKR